MMMMKMTKMAITQPIFTLGSPDFALYQIQIVPTNDDNDDDDNEDDNDDDDNEDDNDDDDNEDENDDDEKPKWP